MHKPEFRIPSGTKIRRIKCPNNLTEDLFRTLHLLQEYGEERFPGIKNTVINFWTQEVIGSASFQSTLNEKNVLTIGFEKADLRSVEETIRLLKLEENPEVKAFLGDNSVGRIVTDIAFKNGNESTKTIFDLVKKEVEKMTTLCPV